MKHVKSALIYSFLLVLSACSNGLVGRWAGDCTSGSSILVEFTGDNRINSSQGSCYGQQGGYGNGYGQQGYGQQGYGQQGYGQQMGTYRILDGNRVSISGSLLSSYGTDFVFRVDGNRLTLSPSYGNSQYNPYGQGYGQQGYNPYGQQGYNPYDPYSQQGGYNPYGQTGYGYGQQQGYGYGTTLTFTRQN
jgi:hypothetical protein